MKKTSFKTFFCSFVFSLFVIFVINGLFFYSPNTSSQELKISNRNISLFFADASPRAVAARTKPVRKIALTLPVTPSSLQVSVKELPPLSAAPPSKPDDKPKPKVRDGISPEIVTAEVQTLSPEKLFDKHLPASEEIVKLPQIPLEKLATADKAKEPPLEVITSITDSNNDTGGDYDTGNDDYSTEDKLNAPQPLLTAQNDIKAPSAKAISSITDSGNDIGGDYDTGNDDYSEKQNLLIPLQKDFADNPSQGAFKVAKTADRDQIAMVSGKTPVGSMTKEPEDIGNGIIRKEPEPAEENVQTGNPKEWESMAEKEGQGSPWVAAKGTKHPKNNAVLDTDYYKKADGAKLQADLNTTSSEGPQIKLASDMVKNILIPIPDDILNDENLTPQLESSDKEHGIEEEVTRREQEQNATADVEHADVSSETDIIAEVPKEENKGGGLLKSITSIFSGGSSSESSPQEVGATETQNSILTRITGRSGQQKKDGVPTKILPAEMRLSFQPNRAEISGSTLKWLQAFANKINSDNSVILEIRIDGTSSYALQQKRLNLLHNILTNKGVDYSKINTVFTTREPNSFIIRTVRVNSNTDRSVKEIKEQAAYYLPW